MFILNDFEIINPISAKQPRIIKNFTEKKSYFCIYNLHTGLYIRHVVDSEIQKWITGFERFEENNVLINCMC